MSRKEQVIAIFCVLATIVAGISIYLTQFANKSANKMLHVAIGQTMAEQTAKVLNGKGKILIIDMESSKAPELKVQLKEFDKRLHILGNFSVEQKTLDTEEQAKYKIGAGLSSRRFLRTEKNHPEADALVSFVGVPRMSEDDFAQAASFKKMPKFIAEVRQADKLRSLFEKKLIDAAIVSRFQFPAPGPEKAHTAQDWFEKRYQVITPQNAETLP